MTQDTVPTASSERPWSHRWGFWWSGKQRIGNDMPALATGGSLLRCPSICIRSLHIPLCMSNSVSRVGCLCTYQCLFFGDGQQSSNSPRFTTPLLLAAASSVVVGPGADLLVLQFTGYRHFDADRHSITIPDFWSSRSAIMGTLPPPPPKRGKVGSRGHIPHSRMRLVVCEAWQTTWFFVDEPLHLPMPPTRCSFLSGNAPMPLFPLP